MSTPITVDEYSRQFFAKYLRGGYGSTESTNLDVSGRNFFQLLIKLSQAGDKNDVSIPLRVLRDEISLAYRSASRSVRANAVHKLFALYERLESECVSASQRLGSRGGGGYSSNVSPGAVSAMEVSVKLIHDELRLRFYKLLAGDTWDNMHELRLMALRMLWNFLIQERERSRRMSGGGGGGGGGGMGGGGGGGAASMPRVLPPQSITDRVTKKLSHKIIKAEVSSWESTFDDLCKTSANRIVSMLRDVMGLLSDAEKQVHEYESMIRSHRLLPKDASGVLESRDEGEEGSMRGSKGEASSGNGGGGMVGGPVPIPSTASSSSPRPPLSTTTAVPYTPPTPLFPTTTTTQPSPPVTDSSWAEFAELDRVLAAQAAIRHNAAIESYIPSPSPQPPAMTPSSSTVGWASASPSPSPSPSYPPQSQQQQPVQAQSFENPGWVAFAEHDSMTTPMSNESRGVGGGASSGGMVSPTPTSTAGSTSTGNPFADENERMGESATPTMGGGGGGGGGGKNLRGAPWHPPGGTETPPPSDSFAKLLQNMKF